MQNDPFSGMGNEDNICVKIQPNVIVEEFTLSENTPCDTEETNNPLAMDEDEEQFSYEGFESVSINSEMGRFPCELNDYPFQFDFTGWF